MSLDNSAIRDLARLARLAVDDAELVQYRQDLAGILGFLDALQSLPGDALEPLAHPLDLNARMRADAITEVDRRAQLQEGAPEIRDGYYLVPRVVE